MQTELNAAIAEIISALKANNINPNKVDYICIIDAAKVLIKQRTVSA